MQRNDVLKGQVLSCLGSLTRGTGMMAALTLGVVRISTALLRSGGSYEEAPSVGPSPCGYSSQHIVLSASVFFFFFSKSPEIDTFLQ